MAAASPLAALLVLAGGLVGVGTAWLPWLTGGSQSANAIDITDTSTLASGYYVLAGGGVAAVCGLLLLLRLGRGTGLQKLLALGAIAGGVFLIAVEVVAYGKATDTVNLASGYGLSVGYGLYAGLAAGIAAAIGGLIALLGRR